MDTSDMAKRMKEYEKVSRRYLMRKQPVILRLDMRTGHTFTRGFKRPFDEVFIKSMQDTAKYLCENIMGAVLSYQQSDEITIVLVDYKKLNSEPWFDNCQNKIESIAASMATMAFNHAFSSNVNDFGYDCCEESLGEEVTVGREEDYKRCTEVYQKKIGNAMFDCRAFNLPIAEVTNNIYWRQLDASRNSIQMVGRANFSHKELLNKSCNDIQAMLMVQKGINWNDLPTYQKRGSCCVRNKIVVERNGAIETYQLRNPKANENAWIIDKDIPIFKGDGRRYIDRLVNVREEYPQETCLFL